MPNDSATSNVLARALQHAQAYLENLDDASVAATADAAALRARLAKPLPQRGIPAEQVIDDLVHDAAPGLLGSAGGRFFGWVLGGALPAAIAADWLASVWDQNAALYACAPSAAIAEEVAGAWLKELLDLPRQSSFALVTGCQLAHLTCLAAARTHLLRNGGWGRVRTRSCRRAANSHSRERSRARFHRACGQPVGLRPRQYRAARHRRFKPRDDRGASACARFDRVCAGHRRPAGRRYCDWRIRSVWGSDPARQIGRRLGAYRRRLRSLGAGERRAPQPRSRCGGRGFLATDGHKLLNTPFDCGYAFVVHPDDHKAALSLRASYLTHAEDARDEIEWNPEWSRRARGFATYAALRNLGSDGVAELFDQCCRHARAIGEGMGALPAPS